MRHTYIYTEGLVHPYPWYAFFREWRVCCKWLHQCLLYKILQTEPDFCGVVSYFCSCAHTLKPWRHLHDCVAVASPWWWWVFRCTASPGDFANAVWHRETWLLQMLIVSGTGREYVPNYSTAVPLHTLKPRLGEIDDTGEVIGWLMETLLIGLSEEVLYHDSCEIIF